MRKSAILALPVAVLLVAGCTNDPTINRAGGGAAAGAAAGGLIGSLSGNFGWGALVGAGVGAAGGLLYDWNDREGQARQSGTSTRR